MDAKQNYLNINLKGGRIIKVGGITASLAPLAVAVALLAGSGVAYAQLTGVVSGGTGGVFGNNVVNGNTVTLATPTGTLGNITTGTLSAGNTTTGALRATTISTGNSTLGNTTVNLLSLLTVCAITLLMLGEAIVSGQVTPDGYVIEKDSMNILDVNVAVRRERETVRVEQSLQF